MPAKYTALTEYSREHISIISLHIKQHVLFLLLLFEGDIEFFICQVEHKGASVEIHTVLGACNLQVNDKEKTLMNHAFERCTHSIQSRKEIEDWKRRSTWPNI